MRYVVSFCVLLLAASAFAHAQLGVYGGFSTSTVHLPYVPRFYGGSFGAYYDGSHHPLVNFGVDVRGSVLSGSGDEKVTAVIAGPRLVLHLPVVPLRAYGEGLVGGAHVKVGQGSALRDSGGFAGGIAVGADLHILPYIDWRVLEYSYSRLQAASTQQQSFTTGLVFRVPLT